MLIGKIKNGYYKLSGIKTLSETIENNEKYLVVKYLNTKETFKEFEKSILGMIKNEINLTKNDNFENSNFKNRLIIMCDINGDEKYYINTIHLKSSTKSSLDRIELYFENTRIGYIDVKKELEGIFTKTERYSTCVYLEDKQVVEFVKYDNSDYINEYSEVWNIEIDNIRGGFNIKYNKKGGSILKKEKSNIVKLRYVQHEKEEKYVTESVIIFESEENKVFELLLILAKEYVDIPLNNEDED